MNLVGREGRRRQSANDALSGVVMVLAARWWRGDVLIFLRPTGPERAIRYRTPLLYAEDPVWERIN